MVVLMILLLFFSFTFELTAAIDPTKTGAVWGMDKARKKWSGLNVSAGPHPN